ncbi:hypothetical protein [Serratia sp. (in: enterobacteria)]|uniref:hypothetical protein n=1 Tax=Serratia sp. (in: enterobacteria) TaxID=616 RepID=UPI0039891B06
MTLLLVQLSPIALVIILILLLRFPPVKAALAGVLLVIFLWFFDMASPVTFASTEVIVKDTLVMFMSTAGVIIPGLAFVILVERQRVPQAIGHWVNELGWTPPAQVLFIILGLAPLLEAMTGFGVSLIATVPLLMGLFNRQSGMKIALSGMVIMPWGTLGLATLIGALLAHLPPNTLGSHSALVSTPVFICLTGIALWLAGIRTLLPWLALLIISGIFIGVLFSVNLYSGPEVSGVLAGLSITVVGLAIAFMRRGKWAHWPKAAWPYLALLGVVVLSRIIFTLTGWDSSWVLTGAHVSWKPLASPGGALILVSLFMVLKQKGFAGFPWKALYYRGKFSVATIFLFLLLSQIMVNGGFLASTQNLLHTLSGVSLAPVLAVLSGLAGYVTGSNVGGNTLIMPSVSALSDGHGVWLAAIVNSAAGHGALGSLSILSLITGLAAASRQEEHSLIRFAFGLVFLNTLIVAVTGVVIFSVL